VSLGYYARKALTLPPRTVARRGWEIIRRTAARWGRRGLDLVVPSLSAPPTRTEERLQRYFPAPPVDILRGKAGEIKALAAHFIGHRFDLLGSGWVEVRHGMRCRGLEHHRYSARDAPSLDPVRRVNLANRFAARRLRRLIEGEYRPIHWHVDFKSGYRWSKRTWYRRVPYGHLPGVDIKVPWELSRMQHLPILAWAHALAMAGEGGFLPPDAYRLEFRNQILDFMSTNPPRFGVNWASTMDVAIRAAGWEIGRAHV
jgi:hypothetical protein